MDEIGTEPLLVVVDGIQGSQICKTLANRYSERL